MMLDFATIFSEIETYVGLFAIFTLLAFLSRGWIGLHWSKDMVKSALTSFGILQFNVMFGGIFFIAFFYAKDTYEALKLPYIPEDFWQQIPMPLTWLILLLVYDIALYWIHRFLHDKWLWPMHAVHHSDEDMHFLSWSRGHALEQTVIAIFVFLCSAWLGVSIEQFFLLAYLKAMHQYYVHTNIDWSHGPFKMILASPQYHRWHHANVEEAFDKNFASIFPFIDWIFGTYYYPKTAVDVPTGFQGSPKNDIIALLAYPFTEWTRMIRRRVKKRSATRTKVETAEQG